MIGRRGQKGSWPRRMVKGSRDPPPARGSGSQLSSNSKILAANRFDEFANPTGRQTIKLRDGSVEHIVFVSNCKSAGRDPAAGGQDGIQGIARRRRQHEVRGGHRVVQSPPLSALSPPIGSRPRSRAECTHSPVKWGSSSGSRISPIACAHHRREAMIRFGVRCSCLRSRHSTTCASSAVSAVHSIHTHGSKQSFRDRTKRVGRSIGGGGGDPGPLTVDMVVQPG